MLTLTSSAFHDHHAIPKHFTCEGEEVSPPLAWSGAPAGTRSFALIVEDPDAPDPQAPQRVFVHWLLYNIPPEVNLLAEGASTTALPNSALQGRNDFGQARYGGPCPPIGRHRYFFKLHALDALLPVGKPLDRTALASAMQGHVLEKAELIGTFQKGDP
jgi:Raf kinase inhibitor-like YbhB/YbcL family protein